MERKFDTTTAFSGGLWLVGMSFPLTVVFLLDLSVSERIAGIAAITAFSLFYLAALGYGHAYPYTADWARFVFWALPLIACVAILTAVIKSHAVVLLPYFAAFCQVCLSPRRGFIALTAIVLAAAPIPASFPVDGSWFMFALAAIVAYIVSAQIAIETEYQSRAELAAELEHSRQREAIYRDVHDVLGHSLTVLSLRAVLARRLATEDPKQAARELDTVIELSRQALRDARSVVHQTHTPNLNNELMHAQQALAAAGIEATVNVESECDEPLFAWVIREAVTNVIKHSGSPWCTIDVHEDSLKVADGGCGLPQGAQLTSINERVIAAGATMTVEGPGTKVVVQL